jgi:iron complex transport system substrate-binding protein
MADGFHNRITRRRALSIAGGAAAGLAAGKAFAAQEASPAASPAGGEWTYTDVLGKTITLPERPVRIAANLVTAAALWDLGIQAVAVFDWTASAYPDGDHIAWGKVDASAVANVGDADGNILPEDMLVAAPDIILTLTFDADDPTQVGGVPVDLAERMEQIAPVLVVTDMASTELQLERLVALGASLGADLEAPGIVEAKAAYDAKVAEFQEVAASKSDLKSAFMNFESELIWVGGPGGVAELQFLQTLGLVFANADSPAAGDFWEELSAEEAIKYPSDIIFTDVYSTFRTAEELQTQPVFAALPAVEAGQVGAWDRDFAVNYTGITDFLETLLVTLRDAEKVTE